MKSLPSLVAFFFALALAAPHPAAADRPAPSDAPARHQLVPGHRSPILHGGTHSDGVAKSASDSFYVYGGPGSVLGKFQLSPIPPGALPDAQGWTGVDGSAVSPHWRVSQTNAASLSAAPANHAVICHHEGLDYVGVGNSWNDWLEIAIDVAALGLDPQSDPADVRLQFDFVHDTEPNYDYFHVDTKSAAGYAELFRIDGSSYVESTDVYEAVSFDSDGLGGIHYAAGGYDDGHIVVRLRVTSDYVYSDEDGLWPSDGRGAVAVDGIQVHVDGMLVSSADWEPLPAKTSGDHPEGDIEGHDNGADAATSGWQPVASEFAGDFSKLFFGFTENDPCRENTTPQFFFVDDGTPPANDPLQRSTGGATSPNIAYGLPGFFVVNYTGGLISEPGGAIHNYIWSPPIALDLPGTADDDALGLELNFSHWNHLPLINGMFAMWHVRFRETGGEWTEWRDNAFLYWDQNEVYARRNIDITRHVEPGADEMQIALGVFDMADIFDFPGTAATPGPSYDDVSVKKFAAPGPLITATSTHLPNDGFPNDGSLTGPVRWDMSFDLRFNEPTAPIVPGDSMRVDIEPVLPGASLADPVHGGVLKVSLLANPEFGDLATGDRAAALALLNASDSGLTDDRGWPIYTFEVLGFAGQPGLSPPEAYFFDLPDGPALAGAPYQSNEPGLFYPGDVLHYYVEAADDQGNVASLPAITSGFLDFARLSSYDPRFVMRALPGRDSGQQPDILVWNDAGHWSGEDEYLHALNEIHLYPGREVDLYTTNAAESQISNGLGSAGAHGATPDQLSGYRTIIYLCGNLDNNLISDGSDDWPHDKSDDLGLLLNWHAQDADRNHAYFGDNFAYRMRNAGTATLDYLTNVLQVDLQNWDIRPYVSNQSAPLARSTSSLACATIDFVANAGCPNPTRFDRIQPLGPAVVPWEFTDPSGNPYGAQVAAAIAWNRLEGNARTKRTMVFPFDLSTVQSPLNQSASFATSARAELLQELLFCFDHIWYNPNPAPDAPSLRFELLGNQPNPFNPATEIRLTAPSAGTLELRVYNVRGELVRVLHDGQIAAGENRFVWDGKNASGDAVASGIYLYEAKGFGESKVRKMAIVR